MSLYTNIFKPKKATENSKVAKLKQGWIEDQYLNQKPKSHSWSVQRILMDLRKFRREFKVTGFTYITSIGFSGSRPPQITIKSETEGKELWQQTIILPEISYSNRWDKTHTLPIEYKNHFYWLAPTNHTTALQVNCTCPDHLFSFHWQNNKVKSHIGKTTPYTKVAGSKRPPRNPKNYKGMCKHLNNLLFKLQDSNDELVGGLLQKINGISVKASSRYSSKRTDSRVASKLMEIKIRKLHKRKQIGFKY